MTDDGKISVMIVDDNKAAIEVLASALESRFSSVVRIVASACSVRDAASLIEKWHPDLLFLDVELPDESGVDYAAELHRRIGPAMKIVLYTSYEKYLIGALRASAFDFLLKPLAESELITVMSRYISARAGNAGVPAARESEKEMSSGGGAGMRRLMVTTSTNDKLVLRPDDVGLFRYHSDRKRWEIVLDNQQTYLLYGQTTAEDILEYAPQYVRIHKTLIININYLAIIQESTCVMLPPFDSIGDLRISKNFRKDLTDRFYSL